MAIIATGSKTIIDLSDGKSLSVYLGANQPRTQIHDVNASTYSPDWTTTAGKLTVTPVVYANQTAIALSNTAGVERSHCQLCTRLTDRLGGNYTNCFAYINRLRSSKVHTVTLRTNTNLTAAFNHRTYLNFFYS